MMPAICPMCEIGTLYAALVDETITYAGKRLLVKNVAISRCNNCTEEVVLPQQARANERVFADAKRAEEGLLTSSEIVRWRASLNLTQAQAATLLGGGVNAFSKYERGEVVQSRPMDLLMRVALESPEARAILSRRAGVDPRPMRTWSPWATWSVAVEAGAQAVVDGIRSASIKEVAANDEVGNWTKVESGCYAACY